MVDTLVRLKNRLSDDEFFELCQMNELRMERLKDSTIIIMEPTGSDTGIFNSEIHFEVAYWNRNSQEGKAFDSSTGFTLPDTSIKSPDTTWIAKERWEKIALDLRKKFAPIAPYFVVEIRSETDSLKELQHKMSEYIANGVRLAWLIDRANRITYIYRLDGSQDIVSFDETLSGENVLNGFRLKISDIEDV
jgi:Uma2 family endonuclease